MHFELLDNFLAEMRAFRQLLLDLFVSVNVPPNLLYLRPHLVVLVKQLLRLFGLVLQLSRQLMVLKDRQPCGRLLLLIIQSQQVGLRLFDFILHFLSELLSGLDLLPLFCDHVKFELLLFVGQLSFNLQ